MNESANERIDPTGAAAAAPTERGFLSSHVMFRRRRFLVNRRYQLRITGITVGTALVLLLLLNFSLFASNQRSTAAALAVAPELRTYLAAQDRFQITLMILGSLAFLAGVFLLGILETHRTAGASYNARRSLEKLREGRYRVRMRLRRGDNLKEIEQAFNDLADTLHSRAIHEAETFEEMAGRAEKISGPQAAALAQEMRALAGERRRLVE